MARIEHPAGVFSGACTRLLAEIAREFTGSGEGGREEDRDGERGGEGRYFLKT